VCMRVSVRLGVSVCVCVYESVALSLITDP